MKQQDQSVPQSGTKVAKNGALGNSDRKKAQKSKRKAPKSTEIPYIRVGTDYYKVVETPRICSYDNGETGTEIVYDQSLRKWSRQTITDDHGAKYLEKIPKYDAFVTVPQNEDYQEIIGNCYNNYHPLEHTPKEGKKGATLDFIRHIFGEQYELGLDYLKLLYERPKQNLPVLCLVSKANNTGKSTFLFWLNRIFGYNLTINDNHDFDTNFNSHWTGKLIIGCEEFLQERNRVTEYIKQLTTGQKINTEGKGKDREQREFFGKFIFCSNNEENFIRITADETRFWVRKVPRIRKKDPYFLAKLEKEIPAFLHFLKTRPFSVEMEDRLWFKPERLRTDALDKVKKANRSNLEKELVAFIADQLYGYSLDEIRYDATILSKYLRDIGIRYADPTKVRRVLKEDLNLEPYKYPSQYRCYYPIGDGADSSASDYQNRKGRYFSFKKSDFLT